MPRTPADLTGKRYGMLTVVGLSGQRNSRGRVLYQCHCDCGGDRLATYANLERGEITSCGCKNHLPKKDLAGQRFGRLTVIEILESPAEKAKTSCCIWKCKCDCGSEVAVTVNALTTGKTKSCGCLQKEFVKSLYRDKTAPCKLRESERPRSSNTSGITGISWDARRERWVAELSFQGKKHFLGRFCKKEDAITARKEAEEKIFGEYLKSLEEEPED